MIRIVRLPLSFIGFEANSSISFLAMLSVMGTVTIELFSVPLTIVLTTLLTSTPANRKNLIQIARLVARSRSG